MASKLRSSTKAPYKRVVKIICIIFKLSPIYFTNVQYKMTTLHKLEILKNNSLNPWFHHKISKFWLWYIVYVHVLFPPYDYYNWFRRMIKINTWNGQSSKFTDYIFFLRNSYFFEKQLAFFLDLNMKSNDRLWNLMISQCFVFSRKI